MTQEELAVVIEQAKKDRSTGLDLSHSKLTELPESIIDTTHPYLARTANHDKRGRRNYLGKSWHPS